MSSLPLPFSKIKWNTFFLSHAISSCKLQQWERALSLAFLLVEGNEAKGYALIYLSNLTSIPILSCNLPDALFSSLPSYHNTTSGCSNFNVIRYACSSVKSADRKPTFIKKNYMSKWILNALSIAHTMPTGREASTTDLKLKSTALTSPIPFPY